jgi:hypothetical protein
MVFMSNLRMSATERLEQLRDFVAAHDRAPSRRTGQQEERSLCEWVAKHKNAETPTGDAVRELIAAARTQCRVATPGGNYREKLAELEQFAKTHRRPPSLDLM